MADTIRGLCFWGTDGGACRVFPTARLLKSGRIWEDSPYMESLSVYGKIPHVVRLPNHVLNLKNTADHQMQHQTILHYPAQVSSTLL